MDVMNPRAAGNNGNDAAHGALFLSTRERQVIGGVVRGLGNRAIAEELGLSEQTVKNVLSTIYAKIGVHTRVRLATYAVHHGLGEP